MPKLNPRGLRVVPRLVVCALVAVLLGLGGWLSYQYWLSDLIGRDLAGKTLVELRADWEANPVSTKVGAPVSIKYGEDFAILQIPKLGDDYAWPIASGKSSLARGLAWYPETSQPGQVGNFALAGHRITHGAPFSRLLELAVDDQVIVETRDLVLTYKIVVAPSELTVNQDAAWVLDPVPGQDDAIPWTSIITLTTAQDRLISPDRSVAFGVLESKKEKT